jgi:hypothetical protein
MGEPADRQQNGSGDPLHAVVSTQLIGHPLPWRIESDWTEEVIASDGYCIAKCATTEEAEAIVAVAVAVGGGIKSTCERRPGCGCSVECRDHQIGVLGQERAAHGDA